ncbi:MULTISPECIES: hypothetical protein [unclassified Bradyrhizobium]|uniref:hypothetical protein n=1 Tax=Bradyrhizobium TaxID=374 RepID=UPI0028E1B8D8|nr:MULTISPECIES: hypothetical protein [unclassified Bradyrhizobium]
MLIFFAVIARLERAIQDSETDRLNHHGRGVLDHPPARVIDEAPREHDTSVSRRVSRPSFTHRDTLF